MLQNLDLSFDSFSALLLILKLSSGDYFTRRQFRCAQFRDAPLAYIQARTGKARFALGLKADLTDHKNVLVRFNFGDNRHATLAAKRPLAVACPR